MNSGNLLSKHTRTASLVFAVLFFAQLPLMAQEPSTFLYRISGNGLAKPSFIWGTIHVDDQQVFNFPDSLYRYLEQADVYAMEVHPDSIVEKALAHYFTKKQRKPIAEMVDAAALQRLKKKYQSKLSKPLEKMTVAEVLMEQQAANSGKQQGGNMGTFMDMYLMVVSRSMGKKVIGLEQVEDQLNLLDELVSGQDPEYILNDFAAAKTTQQLIKSYAAGDLNAVLKMVNTLPPAVEVPFLSARNKIMLEHLVPAMREASVFTAVGVAHLPGNLGLLKLLQQQGYTVTPVFGKKNLHASKYQPPTEGYAASNDWFLHQSPEEGYTASFPGKPVTNDLQNTGFKMHTYIDWATTTYYYSMHVAAQVEINDQNRDSMLTATANASSKNSNGKKAPVLRSLVYKNMAAKEAVFPSRENSTIRLLLVSHAQDLYMMLVAAKDSNNLFSPAAERFFQSLTVLPKQASASSWYQDDEAQFKVLIPGKPQINPEGMQSGEDDADTKEKTIYKRVDGTSNELMIKVIHSTKGYLTSVQSMMQNAMLESVKTMSDKGDIQITDIQWLGRKVQRVKGNMPGNLRYEMRNVVRGARLYSVWYFDSQQAYSQPKADSFFSSFTFLPYPEVQVKKQQMEDVTIGYFGDSATYETNYADEADSSILKAYNPALGVWFTAKRKVLSPFAWAATDSSLLSAMLPPAVNAGKANIVQQRFAQTNGMSALTVLAKDTAAQMWSRYQLIKAGNEVIELSVQTDSLGVQHTSVPVWFNAFTIRNNAAYVDVSKRTAKTVFDSLRICSNEQFEKWVSDVDELPFTKADLPLLLSEARMLWPRDTVVYPSLDAQLWQIIEKVADASQLDLLKTAYHNADSNSSAQGKIVSMLMKMDDANALAFVQQALPLTRQKEVYPGEIFGRFYNNLELAKKLLPNWYPLLSDTTYGPGIVNTYLLLADSNMAPTPPADMPPKVIALSQHFLAILSKPDHEYYSYMDAMPRYLAKMKTPEADALLFDFTMKPVEEDYLRLEALEQLAGNGVFPAQSIQSLAKVTWLRYSVYGLLKKHDRLADLPADLATQAAIGAAYLYELADENFEDPSIELAAEKELLFMGKKYRFFVYKFYVEYDGEKEELFAVAGPFVIDSKQLDIVLPELYVTQISEETFQKKQLDKWLTQYLKEIEKQNAEVEAPKEEE